MRKIEFDNQQNLKQYIQYLGVQVMETITSILETKKSNDNLYETKNEKIIEVGEKIGMKSNFI